MSDGRSPILGEIEKALEGYMETVGGETRNVEIHVSDVTLSELKDKVRGMIGYFRGVPVVENKMLPHGQIYIVKVRFCPRCKKKLLMNAKCWEHEQLQGEHLQYVGIDEVSNKVPNPAFEGLPNWAKRQWFKLRDSE